MAGKIVQIDDYRWQVPQDYKPGMRVPGLIYADRKLFEQIEKDPAVEQVANAAFLPGITRFSLAMPDIHSGYGLPIGGVVATDLEKGVISPGGVGYDINCGVRLLRTDLTRKEIEVRLKDLVNALFAEVPTGVGSKGKIRLSRQDEKAVLVKGARWAVESGFGREEDLAHTEAQGCLEGADPDVISDKAYERGRPQQGTLGSGNHFIEVQFVQEIYDEKVASVFGLFKDQATIMIHSGSRGFGHQVCTDYLRDMGPAMHRYGIDVPDRQLACVPVNSTEGQAYLAGMRAAANFAWANRQGITHFTRQAFKRIFGEREELKVIYDVCHNIAKLERHRVGNREQEVMVHRKGATRAFPPGRREVPQVYQSCGQPVLIPGSMGTASYVLVGTDVAMRETFGTTCHGAGRVMSRTAAKKSAFAQNARQRLEEMGILVRAESRDGISEEIPEAYKDVDAVINVVHNAGLSKRVARLKPIGVIKG